MQRIDERLVQKIGELVKEGVTSVAEMERHLHYFVKREIFGGGPIPDITNRRFFPSRNDIYNYMYRASLLTRHSKIDQENLLFKIEDWKKESPEDMFYLRPATSKNSNCQQQVQMTEDEDDIMWQTGPSDQSEQAKELLFVHQTSWQRKMLAKYGNEICLLDATYKTSRYALPLFFLCVKTNVDYCVVGSFVIQSETRQAIAEALKVFQDWNHKWSPQFFMTDFSDPEIKAIEEVFKTEK